ncbi:MAG: FecR domain-containing protein [Odoribacter splanchnicus]
MEGSVGVREPGSGKVCRIVPGQMAVYDREDRSIAVKETDVTLYTAWKEGLFRFEEVRLEDIMETLSRWYDVDVFFDDDALRHTLFTGDLKRYDNTVCICGCWK